MIKLYIEENGQELPWVKNFNDYYREEYLSCSDSSTTFINSKLPAGSFYEFEKYIEFSHEEELIQFLIKWN